METIYGIDLGTSNCLIARTTQIFGETDVSCLVDSEGNIHFPSVVHYASENEVIVGEKAKELLPQYPEQTVELVKLKVGREKQVEIKLPNGKILTPSPQEVSSLLLRHFNHLHNNEIKKAVLTVPAYFDDNQKSATLQAGQLAGIEIVELIEEPSAAIMYHLFDMYKDQKIEEIIKDNYLNYLVFDFGGGTLDLSLIRVELDSKGNIKPTVLLKGGDSELGGNNIDFEFTRLLIDYLDEEYYDSFTSQLRREFEYYYENKRFRPNIDDKVKSFIMRLKKDLEFAKIRLSSVEEVTIDFGHIRYEEILFTRDELEEEILDPIFRERVLAALDDLKVKNKEGHKIDQVIFVGGTAQIPYFQKLLNTYYPEFRNRIVVSKDYDNAIAKGAAILGAIRAGMNVPPFGTNRCFNTVSHDILVEHRGASTLLIPYGTKFPFTKPVQKNFEIQHSLETNIHILLKEKYEKFDIIQKKRIPQERVIKDVKFYHPFFYTGEQMTVSIQIDEHGLLRFSATHTPTNESMDFEAEKLYQLTDEEMMEIKRKLDRIKEK
jgi:molecular chaperone DnaK